MSKDVFERDAKFYKEHGLGGRMGFGRKPAIVVIDLQLGFTDSACPLGGDLHRVVESCRDLISAAHQKQIPVFFTACAYEEHLKDSGVWGKKVPALSWLKVGSKWVEIDERLGKTPQDIMVIKKYPSAFFGTHLQATPSLWRPLVSAHPDAFELRDAADVHDVSGREQSLPQRGDKVGAAGHDLQLRAEVLKEAQGFFHGPRPQQLEGR